MSDSLIPKLRSWCLGAWRSRTIWLAGATGALGAAYESLETVRVAFPLEQHVGKIMFGLACTMALLRVLTRESLSAKGDPGTKS